MAEAKQILFNLNFQDLNPILAGWAEPCASNGRPSPHFQYHTTLHYVYTGQGTLNINAGQYSVKTGQVFLLPQGTDATFFADPNDPWGYRWLGFTGSLQGDFSTLPPVFDLPEHLLPHLRALNKPVPNLVYYLTSDLHMFYADMLLKKQASSDYVQFVMQYVQDHYAEKLSVSGIADQLGLNWRYLSQLFKKTTGFTIREYLLNVRIREIKRLVMHGSTFKEAMYQCGIHDKSNFYKAFCRISLGSTPAEWKAIVRDSLKDAEID